jgi:hypothetical protein
MRPTARPLREKILPRYLDLSTAKAVALGQRGYTHLDAMRIDLNHEGWISPLARVTDAPPKDTAVYLAITRTATGFVVDLRQRGKHEWVPGPKPRPVGGMAWIPVDAFEDWQRERSLYPD